MTRNRVFAGLLERKYVFIILVLIFVAVAFLRISLAFQSEYVDYDAFNTLRIVDHIKETGRPLFSDELSFGGKQQIFSPVYYYVLAFFSFFISDVLLVKIIPNIFAAAIVFPAFYVVRYITKDDHTALLTSAMTALVPAAFLVSVNDASSLGLILTLMTTAVFFFLKSRKRGVYVNALIIVLIFMSLLHPISLIFLLGLGIYLLLLKVQKIKRNDKELEVFIFYLFFSAWFMMVIFKDAFVTHGTKVIWQNIPYTLLTTTFMSITLLQAISSIGLVTIVLGSFALYKSLGSKHKKSVLLLGSIVFVSLTVLLLRLIALDTGLAVLATFLALSSGYTLIMVKEYFEKTKFPSTHWLFIIGVIVVFVLFLIPLLFSRGVLDTPSKADMDVMSWAKDNLNATDSIMASPHEGFMISYLAQTQNVIDENYLLVNRVDERFHDVRETYSSFFKTDAIENMQKYGTRYLYVSEQTFLFSGVRKPSFVPDKQCFILVYRSEDDVQKAYLYKRTCSLGGESS